MEFLIGIMRNFTGNTINDMAVVLNTSNHSFVLHEKYDEMETGIRDIVMKRTYGEHTPLNRYELTSDVFDLYYEYDSDTDTFTYVGRHEHLRKYLRGQL